MSDLTVGEVVLWLLSWEAPPPDSDERDMCVACKQPCTRPPELEPSALCNLCAQEWAQKIAEDHARVTAELVSMRADLDMWRGRHRAVLEDRGNLQRKLAKAERTIIDLETRDA
jgi:hypothetical protein